MMYLLNMHNCMIFPWNTLSLSVDTQLTIQNEEENSCNKQTVLPKIPFMYWTQTPMQSMLSWVNVDSKSSTIEVLLLDLEIIYVEQCNGFFKYCNGFSYKWESDPNWLNSCLLYCPKVQILQGSQLLFEAAYCLYPLISLSILLAFLQCGFEISCLQFSLPFLLFPSFAFPVFEEWKPNIELQVSNKIFLCILIIGNLILIF